MIPMAIAGAASLAGGLLANRSARGEAQRNREFQEKMSSTSWQRGVADMEAAGLNPALAYGKGGATAPSGSMAAQDDVATPAVGSAMQAKRLTQELKNMKEQERDTYNAAQLKRQQSLESAHRRELVVRQQTQTDIQNQQLRLQIPWLEATAKAVKDFPQAALLRLITQSGGAGMIGSLMGGTAFAGAQLRKYGSR